MRVLLAAIRWMRSDCQCQDIIHAQNRFLVQTELQRHHLTILRCWWPTGIDGVEHREAEEQITLRLREEHSVFLADELVRELGRIAAWIDLPGTV
jgi:hypothetical protein